MKKNTMKLFSIMSLLISVFGCVAQVTFFNIDGFNGSSHEAFKVAEYFLKKSLSHKSLQLDMGKIAHKPFLASLVVADNGIEYQADTYGLVSGDVCKGMVWLDQNSDKSGLLKNVAGKIVYLKSSLVNGAPLLENSSEYKKLCQQLNELQESERFCCAIVSNVSFVDENKMGVIVINKTSKDIKTTFLGDYDKDVIVFLHSMLFNKVERKNKIINSLQRYYSSDFAQHCCNDIGLKKENEHFISSLLARSINCVNRVIDVARIHLSIVQYKYRLC